MPATEETFRNQSRLHIVFAISSIAMMLSIVWMILADHLRPWKDTQRQFHFIENAKLRVSEAAKQAEINQKQQKEIEEKIANANLQRDENGKQIRAQEVELKRIVGQFEAIDTATRFQKAEKVKC